MLLQCKYQSKHMSVLKSRESYIVLNFDSIQLKNDKIKYDYISHFIVLSDRTVGIVMFTKINYELNMEKNDSLSIVILTFTSNNSRINFMKDILNQINLYKTYNDYDKSIIDFKTFKKVKY